MKKYVSYDDYEEDGTINYYYAGTAREVASLYKNFLNREIATPAFCDYPKFNMDKHYALSVTDVSSDEIPTMMVISSDTFVSLLLDYEMTPC